MKFLQIIKLLDCRILEDHKEYKIFQDFKIAEDYKISNGLPYVI